nr:2-oxo acid dehydrogenase subunit E2 [Pseudomonas sp. IT1137]
MLLQIQRGRVNGSGARYLPRRLREGADRALDIVPLVEAEVVPVFIVGDADLHRLAQAQDPLVRLAQAIAAACQVEPVLNSWFDGKGLSLKRHAQLDLGIAVDTADGQFVPVLRNVGARSAEDLKEGIARLRADVKARSIPPQEMMGAPLTLSNFGTLFGRYANPLVMPPQVAIIGAGGIRDEPVAVDGKVQVHPILPLSLTVDHRALTGGEAARFLKAQEQAEA